MAQLLLTGSTLTSGSVLDQALQLVESRLKAWAGSSNSDAYNALLLEVFGVQSSEATGALQAALGGTGLGISLEILDGATLRGINGAYTSAAPRGGERIYLNGAWLQTATAAEIEAVLLEELGHAIDYKLNGSADTLGDKGEIFSGRLRGLTPASTAFSENDQRLINLNGVAVAIEAAADTIAPTGSLGSYATAPAYAAAATNPFGISDVGGYASPAFADADADGDLDLFIGNQAGNTLFFRNTAATDANDPAYAAAATNPFATSDVTPNASPAFADADGDGDLDLFIGNYVGDTLFFGNTAATPVAPVSSTTANGSYGIGTVISLTVQFSEAVLVTTTGGTPTLALETGSIDRYATYSGGSGTITLSFSYTVQADDTSSDLDQLSANALTLNGGTIKDAAGNNAILTLAAPGATGSLGANAALVIDTTPTNAPTITSVTDDAGTITGTLTSGDSTDDTDLTVTVTLPTTGTLAVAGDTIQLYNSSTALGSAYTLLAADIDYGFANVATGNLTDGTSYTINAKVIDSAGNASSASDNVSVTVDTTATNAPTITSVTDNVGSITGTLTSGGRTDDTNLTVTVTLPTTGTLAVAGDTIQLYNSSTALGSAYTLLAGDITAGFANVATDTLTDGTSYTINAKVIDSAGNASSASGDFSVTVDTTPPIVTDANISISGATGTEGAYKIGDMFTAVYDPGDQGLELSSVTVDFSQFGGGSAVTATLQNSGNNIDKYVATYSIVSGDLDTTNCNVSVTATDNAGNPTTTADSTDASVDSIAPIGSLNGVAPVSSTTADGSYGIGERITLTVEFSEAVVVNTTGGTPRLQLETGSTDHYAFYSGGSGTTTLSFLYGVQAGDHSTDLDQLSAEALQLNGGTIQDVAGNNAILTLAAPGAAGSLGANAALVIIDSSAPHGAFGSYATAPAYAAATTNPFGITDVVGWASPAFADADGDGDLDLFIGNRDGNTIVFRNTANPGASAPAYAAAATNPFGITNVGNEASPAFADADGDGDLDLFIGNSAGNIVFFRNTAKGVGSDPAYATATENPFGITKGGNYASPAFADADADGDLDLFIGNNVGTTLFFQNTANPGADDPAYATATANPFGISNVGGSASPAFADADADGDLDLFIGNNAGNTLVFINTAATPVAPVSSLNADGGYGIGAAITLTVQFSKPVVVNTKGGTPTLQLETGVTNRFALYDQGSGTDTLSFLYIVQSGDSSADLDQLSAYALQLNGGTIQDETGQNAILVLAAPGAEGSLGANADLVIDTTAPTITEITVQGNQLLLQFSEGINTTGLLPARFGINVAGLARTVSAIGAGSDASQLLLTLAGTAPTNDQTVSLTYTDLTADNDSSGVIQDSVGNDLATIAPARNADTYSSAANVTSLATTYANLTLTGTATSGSGNAGNNTIRVKQATPVANVLTGGAGTDSIDGAGGSDVYIVGSSLDHPAAEISDSGNSGTDELRFSSSTAAQTLTVIAADTGLEWVTIGTGTAAAPVLTGTTALNVDASLAPNALTITGNAGANSIIGGASADVITGNAGNDSLDGGNGGDLYLIGSSADRTAAEIKDTGTSGTDELRFSSTTAAQTLTVYAAETGLERVTIGTGTAANADLSGTTALNVDASLAPNALTIKGNAAANVITGSAFVDSLDGGSGGDLYLISTSSQHTAGEINDSGTTGTDELRFSSTTAAQTLTVYAADTGLELVTIGTGSAAAPVLTGTTALNVNASLAPNALTITGNAGANSIIGGASADVITGNAGNDSLDGGNGGDLYLIASSADRTAAEIKDTGAAGTDELRFSSSTAAQTLTVYAAETGLERVTIGTGSAAAPVLTGTTALNVNASLAPNALTITGNAGANSIIGGASADVITGNAGNDSLDGGNGGDLYLIASSADRTAAEIKDSGTTGTDELRFSSTTAAETLAVYAAETGLEMVSIGTGTAASADLSGTTALNVDASLTTNALRIQGNAGDNVITGTVYADQISGNEGNDSIIGGRGNDSLSGGTGADIFRFDTAPNGSINFDAITDFLAADGDIIQLENAVYTALTTTGTLADIAFANAAMASTSAQRVLYNSVNGQLLYDSDGSGSLAPILFATLSTGLTLSNTQFTVT